MAQNIQRIASINDMSISELKLQTNIDSTSAAVLPPVHACLAVAWLVYREQKKDTRAVQSKHLQLPIEDELPKIYGQNTVATLLLQKLSAVESVRKHMFT